MKLYLGTDEGLAVFEGQEEVWHPRYLRMQDRKITALMVAGKTLWAGTANGLWRSTSGGSTWLRAATGLQGLHVRAMTAHPELPNLLLVGTEPASILVSRDGGETWTEAPDVTRLRDEHDWSLPYSPAAGCIRGFAVLGDRVYAAAEVGGVLRSDDYGSTWRLLEGDVHPDVHDVGVRHAIPDLVFAATGGGRYRSQDGGGMWTLIGDGYTRAIWPDPERPGVVLAGPARYVGAMGRIERSMDDGSSWMLASDGLDIPMTNMIERFVAADTHVLAVTSDGKLYTAKCGVWIWRPLDLGVPLVRAAVVSDA